jgi:zinc D-Ala-D-Ala carboxypeptidase
MLDGEFALKWTWTFGWGSTVYKPKFFTDDEIKGLDPEFVALLDWARGRAKIPFVITRGAVTPEQNKKDGGVENSAHLRGLAVDLHLEDGAHRFKMVQALVIAGFKRIGVYDKHVHVDADPTLPQEVMWVGVSH